MRALLACFCIVMFLFIGITGFTASSTELSSERIIINDADIVLIYDFESSAGIINVVKDITSRIVVEYADYLIETEFDKPEGLIPISNIVTPRIIVEYADSIHKFPLQHPSWKAKSTSSISISSSTTPISVNQTISISGHLSPIRSGNTVVLTYIKPDGTDFTRTIITNSDGKYIDSFTPDQTGDWQVKAGWTGDENFYGTESSTMFFKVTPIISTYYLTIKSGHGSVDGDGLYPKGSSASFSVSSTIVSGDSGVRYVFTGWSSTSFGGYNGPDNPAIVVINNNITETVQWKTQYYVTMQSSGGGSVSPISGWYDDGTEVNITATPDPGYSFFMWLGSGLGSYSGSDSSHIITVNGHITEIASFENITAYMQDITPPITRIISGPSGIITYNDVDFEWTGTDDKTSMPYLEYSYQLIGYDSEWSQWTSSTSKHYRDLTRKSYMFKVKARDGARNEDPNPVERSFRVGWPIQMILTIISIIAAIIGIILRVRKS